MTTQEQQMLEGLTDRINQTQLSEKDPEAEQYLQSTLGRNADALYILAQTVLVTQYALEQAQKQLAEAKSQVEAMRTQAPAQAQPPRHATSFLGSLLGLGEQPTQPAPPPMQQVPYAPVPGAGGPGYAAVQGYGPGYGPGPGGPLGGQAPGQGGGFLRSAMQTATGVAAGTLAFQGIESLMHGFGGGGQGFGGGFGGGLGGGLGGGNRPEEIVNNYYGDSDRGGHEGQGDLAGRLSPDVEDRRDDSRSFADTGDAGSGDGPDDASIFDNSGDDSGSMDDSSSGDDSGSTDDGSF